MITVDQYKYIRTAHRLSAAIAASSNNRIHSDTQSRAVSCICICLVKSRICQGFYWLWVQVMRTFA